MKKLIFRGPVQTASGYGVHSRMLLNALDKSGKFDITVMSIPWGSTPLIYDETPEMNRIKELSFKFNPQVQVDYDVSVQVTIPNEFMKMAKKNVCVTAGIETDKVAKIWQDKTNEVADVLVVPSVHSARSFTTAIFGDKKGPEQVLLRKPLYILPEWVDLNVFNTKSVDTLSGLDDMPDFNFVSVGLGLDKNEGEDRKNFALLIRWFCEQFKGSQDVGLVLKLSMVNTSEVDFKIVRDRIQFIKAQAGCGQFPKIKLIHGRLSDLELAALYKHPKIKAFISTTHGEGYGLPIFEAAACGLPVLATNWSGHLDFLKISGKNKFIPLECKVETIPEGAVWENVIERGTKWANPIEQDVKLKMAKVVLSYDKPKQWAMELAEYISENINDNLGQIWANDIEKMVNDQPVNLTKNLLVRTNVSDKKLDSVTLVAITDVKIEETINALKKSMNQISFSKVKLFSSAESLPIVDGIENIKIDTKLDSVESYDNFVAKELHKYVDTEHALIVQWDGYVLNGSAWNEEYLKYDYVGAPWFWDNVVGNSGFVLQSKKLLAELASGKYEVHPQYDSQVCRILRNRLENVGIKFAPTELANSFSVENLPYTGQFGWHGENPFNGDM